VSELQSRFSAAPVDDGVLVDRVRSQLGHIVAHPGTIQVTAQNGKVTLSGPIRANEVDNLLSCVRHVNGVNEVVNNFGGA
jgi:osmotically-inducible protein OsmY